MANHKKCCLSLLLSKYDDDESLGNYDDGEDDVYDIEAAAESQRLTAFIRSSAIRSLCGVDGGLVVRRNARTDWIGFQTQEQTQSEYEDVSADHELKEKSSKCLTMMVIMMGAVRCPTCALSITPKWSPWDVSGATTTASSTIAWCFIHNKWQQAARAIPLLLLVLLLPLVLILLLLLPLVLVVLLLIALIHQCSVPHSQQVAIMLPVLLVLLLLQVLIP